MATRYVNTTGSAQSGGWGVGADSGGGTTIGAPLASLHYANSLGTSDTIYIYGSTASPVEVPCRNTASAIWSNTATFLAWEDYGVILVPSASATSAVMATNSGATLTFGASSNNRFIIDAKNTTRFCLESADSTASIVCYGTRFRNFKEVAVTTTGNLTINGAWSATTTTSFVGSSSTPCAAIAAYIAANSKTVTLGAGDIDIVNTAASGTVYGIVAKSTSNTITGGALTIGSGTDIRIEVSNAAVHPKGIMTTEGALPAGSIASISAEDVTITTVGPSTAATGADFSGNSATNVASTISINNISATHIGSTPSSGVGIRIGNDTNGFAAGSLPITVTAFNDCTCTNYWHGIMGGGINNLSINRPSSVESNLGVIIKNCTNSVSYGGYHLNPRDTALRFKSSTSCTIGNQTVVITKAVTGYAPEGAMVANNDGSTASASCLFENNNLYMLAGATIKCLITVSADFAGQVTFDKNNYYAASGFGSACTTAFAIISGVNTTYATWTATETTATNVDPKVIGSTGRLLSSSPLISAGASIPTGTTDNLDNPYRTPPTVGGFEYINGSGSNGGGGLIGSLIS